MKSVIVLLISLFSLSSFAIDLGDILDGLSRGGDRGRQRGGIECTANDRGWEEHWGGHGSCGECLREHGDCIEVCKETYYTCTAQGVDQAGQARTETASGVNRWRAEDSALRRCSFNYRSCTILDCQSQEEVVSRERCHERSDRGRGRRRR